MKLEKFFNWVQNKLLNYPDLDFNSIKMFIDKFYCYLSKKERERYSLQYQMIKEFTSKQLSLDSIVHKIKIDNLEVKINELKKE